MPKEYIERDVAIEKTETFCDVFVTQWTDEKVLAWIKNLPAADVVEVVRGRWVDNGIPESMLSKCSVCDYSCGAYSFNYCPNCGAKMEHD